MEIEFSKDGKGKVLIGIGCKKAEDGSYQKILNIDDISMNDCEIGEQLSRSQAGETLLNLVFYKDESIDVLIRKLQALKNLDAEKTIITQREICNDPDCMCRLPLGC